MSSLIAAKVITAAGSPAEAAAPEAFSPAGAAAAAVVIAIAVAAADEQRDRRTERARERVYDAADLPGDTRPHHSQRSTSHLCGRAAGAHIYIHTDIYCWFSSDPCC